MASIFTKIIERKIPATIVYEDETSIVIRDIAPKMKTHLLIIPKHPIPNFHTIVDPLEKKIVQSLRDIARHLCETYQIDNVKFELNSGYPHQEIPHLHLHFLSETEIR